MTERRIAVRTSDIFTTVTKYDIPEDRFTASLVFLLEYLWRKSEENETQRKTCSEFLKNLCCVEFAPHAHLEFELQKPEKGPGNKGVRPDFQIRSDNELIWVEVKDSAPVKQNFRDYRNELRRKAKAKKNKLVLLRHHYVDPDKRKGVDKDIRWSQLYTWLEELRVKFPGQTIGHWLLKQFQQYLEGKGVPIVERIDGKRVVGGLKDLISLLTIIREEAPKVFEEKAPKSGRAKHLGKMEVKKVDFDSKDILLYLDVGKEREQGYLVCLSTDEPSTIWMGTKRENVTKLENRRISEDKLKELKDKKEPVFDEDENNWIWSHRTLATVFQEVTAPKQEDRIHNLLAEMFDDFEQIKT
jgi:hypothetical protein